MSNLCQNGDVIPFFRWSFLEIKTISTTADDLELAKAAGMAEGAATGSYPNIETNLTFIHNPQLLYPNGML